MHCQIIFFPALSDYILSCTVEREEKLFYKNNIKYIYIIKK